MIMKKLSLLLFALILMGAARAAVRLPHVLSDGMVLQQQSSARLWGQATPGATVTVTASWDGGKPVRAKVSGDGRWEVRLVTPAASFTPRTITVTEGKGPEVTLRDVLIGEVWVCAGQSNMEFPVKGFGNCPLKDYNEVVSEASRYDGIRFLKIPSVMSSKPLDDAPCRWRSADVAHVGDCSAVGYFFARQLRSVLNIPVGLILANKGGTRVESWLDQANLERATREPLDSMVMTRKFPYDYDYPLLWGNGTFHPILNYTVKGILFYQGCSNVGAPGNEYSDRLALLVSQWRRDFGEGNIPFYFVQLAPYADNGDPRGTQRALLEEQQMRAADIIPNSGLVCTNDCVYPWEQGQIHPCNKKPVGDRLGWLALEKTYHQEGLQAESPRFDTMFIQGDTCFIRLKDTYGGISRYQDIEGFEVAGADKVFHRATAGHFWVPGHDPRNETIYVVSPEVPKPVAVRYCFRNFQIGNLGGNSGLPLFPFRTDNW